MHKKKKWTKKLVGIFLLIVWIHVISAMTLDRVIEYKEIDFFSEKITKKTDEYVIAFVTDTHAISANELREVVQKINERNVDVLLLGGDFPNGSAAYHTMQIFGETKTKDGIYGVEGNHDDIEELTHAMKLHGIHLLENEGTYLQENLYVAGVEDLWNRNPDIQKAIEGTSNEDFILVLSHNPDVAMEQDMQKVNLMLSGHTHGGQMTFFGFFAPALALQRKITKYGQMFKSGWVKTPSGGTVYVSNGTGQIETVPRIFARPQVIFMTLRVEKK